MRKVILFLCVGVLNLAGLTSFAQLRLGVKAGINTSSMGLNFEDSDDEKTYRDVLESKLGFSVGLATEYGFTNTLSLQTGLQFIKKGFKMEREEGANFEKRKTSISYLEVPVHLAFKVSKFQVHAGPYVGFGLANKSKYEYNFDAYSGKCGEFDACWGNGEIKYKFKNKVSESDLDGYEAYLRRLDVGFNLGAGYRFGPVLVTATYAKGLSNLYPKYATYTKSILNLIPKYDGDNEDEDKTTNKGFSLTATWFLQIK